MMKQLTTTREERGQAIAQLGNQIQRVDDYLYIVKSQSNNGEYTVYKVDNEWLCDCPDNTYRHLICKHIFAVDFSLSMRNHIEAKVISPINTETITECMYCGSPNIKKYGLRHNKSGDLQRYLCRDCHKKFSYNVGFEKMKHNPQAVTTAIQLYFSGISLRGTVRSLKLMHTEVSHQTVYNWINKYITLMKSYADKITPNVSDTWRADELYVKIAGEPKYLFAMMDDKTRYLIAQEVAETKDQHDARNLLRMSKDLMRTQPAKFITDGLLAYNTAYKAEYCKPQEPKTEHERHITLQGDRNNNKMERLNGEIRDREKTMRGLKKDASTILDGYQIYHNYIRPHEALNGKTPSEACGITVEGENKWITLIQNATKAKVSEE